MSAGPPPGGRREHDQHHHGRRSSLEAALPARVRGAVASAPDAVRAGDDLGAERRDDRDRRRPVQAGAAVCRRSSPRSVPFWALLIALRGSRAVRRPRPFPPQRALYVVRRDPTGVRACVRRWRSSDPGRRARPDCRARATTEAAADSAGVRPRCFCSGSSSRCSCFTLRRRVDQGHSDRLVSGDHGHRGQLLLAVLVVSAAVSLSEGQLGIRQVARSLRTEPRRRRRQHERRPCVATIVYEDWKTAILMAIPVAGMFIASRRS